MSEEIEIIKRSIAGEFGPINQLIGVEFMRLAATVVRKNRDYSSSVFMDVQTDDGRVIPAEQAIQVRLNDKTNRIKTLRATGKALVNDESIADTYRDKAVYTALLGMLVCKDVNGLSEAMGSAAKPAPQPEAKAEIEIWVPEFVKSDDGLMRAKYEDGSCLIYWPKCEDFSFSGPGGSPMGHGFASSRDAATALAAAGYGPAKCQKPKGVKHD